jgi:hypothetical protein
MENIIHSVNELVKNVKDPNITVFIGSSDEYSSGEYSDDLILVWIKYPISEKLSGEKVIAKFESFLEAETFAKKFIETIEKSGNIKVFAA